MPLTTCVDCAGAVSTAATACPHCGRPSGRPQVSPVTEAVIGGCLLVGSFAVPVLLVPLGLLALVAIVRRARAGSRRGAIVSGLVIGLLGIASTAVFGNSPGMVVVVLAVCAAAILAIAQGQRRSRRFAAERRPLPLA